jgi:hypothetical protein
MIADKACYERGCACHDSREGDGIEVIEKKPWVGLTEQKIESAYWDYMETPTQNGFEKSIKALEGELKEKNYG